MSKPVDQSKIEKIREAAVSVIVEQGLHNASVAAIAKRAGVSVGYLYRHYPGKDALIDDLLGLNFNAINLQISELIREGKGLEYIMAGIVNYIISIADEHEDKVRFIITIFNYLSLNVSRELSERIDDLAEELLIMARKDPAVRQGVGKEDIFVAMVGLPLNYLSTRYTGIIRGNRPSSGDARHVVRASLNIIFKDNPNNTGI